MALALSLGMNRQPVRCPRAPFKRCTLCGEEWATKEAFLNDRQVRLDGYQWSQRMHKVRYPARGVLIFTHRAHSCGTSLAIAAERFKEDAGANDQLPCRP